MGNDPPNLTRIPTRAHGAALSVVPADLPAAGYGAFSISPSHKKSVSRSIARQREHRTTTTFHDVCRELQSKCGIKQAG